MEGVHDRVQGYPEWRSQVLGSNYNIPKAKTASD